VSLFFTIDATLFFLLLGILPLVGFRRGWTWRYPRRWAYVALPLQWCMIAAFLWWVWR
jgi:hypothetical protein